MSSKIASSVLSDKAAKNHTARENSNVRKWVGKNGWWIKVKEIEGQLRRNPSYTHTHTPNSLKPVWTEVPKPRKRYAALWQMSSLGLASSVSRSGTSLIMQHAFAQTCLTDVHRLSLRFPTARQQTAVIFRKRWYNGCAHCFRYSWLSQDIGKNKFVIYPAALGIQVAAGKQKMA